MLRAFTPSPLTCSHIRFGCGSSKHNVVPLCVWGGGRRGVVATSHDQLPLSWPKEIFLVAESTVVTIDPPPPRGRELFITISVTAVFTLAPFLWEKFFGLR